MVSQSLQYSIQLCHIILFCLINLLYLYLAVKICGKRVDRIAKIVMFLYYIVFLSEFISAGFNNDSTSFSITVISAFCYYAIQIATIIFLKETQRVKLILSAKTPLEFMLKNKQSSIIAYVMFIFLLISLFISIFRLTIVQLYPQYYQQLQILIIILTSIDLTICIIVLLPLIFVFQNQYFFFLNQQVLYAGHKSIPLKLKLLKLWGAFLVFQNMIDVVFRIFVKVVIAQGNEVFLSDWATDIWIPSIGILQPFTTFCEILSFCIMIISMSNPSQNNFQHQDNNQSKNTVEYTFETLTSLQNEEFRFSINEFDQQTRPQQQQSYISAVVSKKSTSANSNSKNSSHKSGEHLANNAMQRWGLIKDQNKASINNTHQSFDISMMEANNLLIHQSVAINDDQQVNMVGDGENEYEQKRLIVEGIHGLEIFTGFLEQLTLGYHQNKQSTR